MTGKHAFSPGDVLAPAAALRWRVLFLVFTAAIINHVDRQALSILKPTLSAVFGWSEMDYADIVLAFQAAYALGFLAWGRVMDRIKPKCGMACCVWVWSLAALAHALARSAGAFGVFRFCLGLGESGHLPAGFKIVCKWFPPGERSLALGVFNGGASVGAMLAPFLVAWLTLRFGWPAAFAATGGLGLAWLAAWRCFYDDPAVAPAAREPAADGGGGPDEGAVAMSRLLRWRTTWGCLVAGSLSIPMASFYLFWLPDFLTKTHGLRLDSLGLPLLIIYLGAGIGSIAGGALSSGLIAWGVAPVAARKAALIACLVGIVPVALAPGMADPGGAAMLIAVALAAHQGWVTNLWALLADLLPHRAQASVFGLGGLVGALSGMVMAKVVGGVLESTGGYGALFPAIPAVYAVSLLALQALLPRAPERL